MRTRSRRTTNTTNNAIAIPATTAHHDTDPSDDDEDEETTLPKTFTFNGKTYATYQEMVTAKRQRNQERLLSSGLMDAKAAVESMVLEQKRSAATARGLKRSERQSSRAEQVVHPRRKSSRLAGVSAPGIYVDSERSGEFTIAGGVVDLDEKMEEEARNFNNRVNDGSDLSVAEAVELTGSKWVRENTVVNAKHFMTKVIPEIVEDYAARNSIGKSKSPTSVAGGTGISAGNDPNKLQSRLDALSLDDETCVAKVTPERIYSVACHPSPHHVIACAGDKTGHVGLWNVNQYGVEPISAKEGDSAAKSASNDGVHLFKPHGGAVSQLIWNAAGTSLLSSSYDGSVRVFDANKQVFQEVFATYDDSSIYKDKLGYGLDQGYSSWVQCMELDHRFGSDGKCFFLATSEGNAMHVDLRSKGKVTFNLTFSERKINTVSLHPNGNIMATGGLDTIVKLWDLRNITSSSEKTAKPFAWQHAGKSISSAYFSPSGKRLVTTTMSNTIDILEDAHTASGLIKVPKHRIRHDNMTGRWLSTFMARWHNESLHGDEIFVVGSMQKPRTIEIFSGSSGKILREIRGEALTAVASRCCFHPSSEKLIVVGGNSSGRVTVTR